MRDSTALETSRDVSNNLRGLLAGQSLPSLLRNGIVSVDTGVAFCSRTIGAAAPEHLGGKALACPRVATAVDDEGDPVCRVHELEYLRRNVEIARATALMSRPKFMKTRALGTHRKKSKRIRNMKRESR